MVDEHEYQRADSVMRPLTQRDPEMIRRDNLIDFTHGYFAAQRGEPDWPHNTEAWRDGHRFYAERWAPQHRVGVTVERMST